MVKPKYRLWIILVISVLFILITKFLPINYVFVLWTLSVLYLILITATLSNKENKFAGWLIDKRKRYSLSRLQMTFWTFLVLSSLITAVIINIKSDFALVALIIDIPEEIMLAMGISYGSGVGSYYILKEKGYLKSENIVDKDPKLSDFYTCETVDTEGTDFTRLQELYITIILCVAYGMTLIFSLSQAVKIGSLPIDKFPEFSSSLLVLLTVSHAGYLGKKIAYDKKISDGGGDNKIIV